LRAAWACADANAVVVLKAALTLTKRRATAVVAYASTSAAWPTGSPETTDPTVTVHVVILIAAIAKAHSDAFNMVASAVTSAIDSAGHRAAAWQASAIVVAILETRCALTRGGLIYADPVFLDLTVGATAITSLGIAIITKFAFFDNAVAAADKLALETDALAAAILAWCFAIAARKAQRSTDMFVAQKPSSTFLVVAASLAFGFALVVRGAGRVFARA
jgi:hypothetical protein